MTPYRLTAREGSSRLNKIMKLFKEKENQKRSSGMSSVNKPTSTPRQSQNSPYSKDIMASPNKQPSTAQVLENSPKVIPQQKSPQVAPQL